MYSGSFLPKKEVRQVMSAPTPQIQIRTSEGVRNITPMPVQTKKM